MALDLGFLDGIVFASILWVLIVAVIFVLRNRKKGKPDKRVDGEVEDQLPYLDEMIKG